MLLVCTAFASAAAKKKHPKAAASTKAASSSHSNGKPSVPPSAAAAAQAKAAASTASARSAAGLRSARAQSYRPGSSHAKGGKKPWRGPVPRAPRPQAVVHHGQHSIEDERAREIQEALIREKYLDGEPSGSWDQRTRDAMTRFQSDHGWQSKVVPDARALIKLGLGPKHADLLNPEAAARDLQPGGVGVQQ